jgi:hypothetical protein
MTKKRRYLISAGILAACVCIALGVLALLPQRPGVTKANFDRTATRMTKIEISKLLGPPSDLSPNGTCWSELHNGKLAPGHERVVWGGDDGAAVFVFDEGERVVYQTWVENQQTFTDRLRRWLRFP